MNRRRQFAAAESRVAAGVEGWCGVAPEGGLWLSLDLGRICPSSGELVLEREPVASPCGPYLQGPCRPHRTLPFTCGLPPAQTPQKVTVLTTLYLSRPASCMLHARRLKIQLPSHPASAYSHCIPCNSLWCQRVGH